MIDKYRRAPMPIDATITLDTLHCFAEHDTGSGGSEPYIWPIYFWSDRDLQNRLEFIELQAASKAQPSAPLAKGMRTGDSVRLPFPSFTRQIDGRLDGEGIGLIVVLLEADKTPEHAMTVGRNTLVALLQGELRAFIRENGRAPHTGEQAGTEDCTEEPDENGICDEVTPIVDRIRPQVEKAISGQLNLFQKLRNQDDILGFALYKRSLAEGDRVEEELVLDIRQGDDPPRQHYQVTGHLNVRPTVPVLQRCVSEREALQEAQKRVEAIELEITQNEAQLHEGLSGAQKAGLIARNRELNNKLPAARAAVATAQRRLTVCLERFEPVKPAQGFGPVEPR
jgi:hypothetical protein